MPPTNNFFKKKNNAGSTLTAPLLVGGISVSVPDGQETRFPMDGAFVGTINLPDQEDRLSEIVVATWNEGTGVFDILGEQEGTSRPLGGWGIGAIFENKFTVAQIQELEDAILSHTHDGNDSELIPPGVPVGMPLPWFSNTLPTEGDWLLLDGTVKAIADYPELHAVYGTQFNTGGETADQFRLPNPGGKVFVGRIAGDATFGTIGSNVGSSTATTSSDGSHSHTVNSHTHTVGAHTHWVYDHSHSVGGGGHTSGGGGGHSHSGTAVSSGDRANYYSYAPDGYTEVSDNHQHGLSINGVGDHTHWVYDHGHSIGGGGHTSGASGAFETGGSTPGTSSAGTHTHTVSTIQPGMVVNYITRYV